jgi:hypothetical protein
MTHASVVQISEQLYAHPSVPQVPDPADITQLELAALLSLKTQAFRIDRQVAEAERSIRTRLESGALVEPGDRVAELKESSRRTVSWREVTERLADRLFGSGKGDAYCERVLRSTKPSRSVSLIVR